MDGLESNEKINVKMISINGPPLCSSCDTIFPNKSVCVTFIFDLSAQVVIIVMEININLGGGHQGSKHCTLLHISLLLWLPIITLWPQIFIYRKF